MERLIFATQKLDPDDPVLAATVPMVHALAERVDELVVLCDSALPEAVPRNARVHAFAAATQDIARNVQGVAAGTRAAATDITEVNRGATQTGAAFRSA